MAKLPCQLAGEHPLVRRCIGRARVGRVAGVRLRFLPQYVQVLSADQVRQRKVEELTGRGFTKTQHLAEWWFALQAYDLLATCRST
jgi:hypothetical protein